MAKTDKKNECYGVLDTVFPMGPEGLREVAENCMKCESVKECLKAASESPDGMEMKVRRMENNPTRGGGVVGFLSRWSELKSMRSKSGEK